MIELVMILCTESYAVSWPKCHGGEVTIEQIFRSHRLFLSIAYFYQPFRVITLLYVTAMIIYNKSIYHKTGNINHVY